MLLSTTCKSCNHRTEKSYAVTDRIELAQKYGDHIEMMCVECGASEGYHPDDYKAVTNVRLRWIVLGIAVSIALIGGLVTHFLLSGTSRAFMIVKGVMYVAPLFIFVFFVKQDTDAIRLFNRQKLKGYNVDANMKSTAGKVNISKVEKKNGTLSALKKHNTEQLKSNKK